jgi:hypothetical protein
VQQLCNQNTDNTLLPEQVDDGRTDPFPNSQDNHTPTEELPAYSPTWAVELEQAPAAGQLLALHPDDPVTFTDDGTLDTHEVRFDTMLEGTDLNSEERQPVVQFLQLNADVFCWEPIQLECCTLGYHTIDT